MKTIPVRLSSLITSSTLRSLFALFLLLLICFGLSPTLQAVNPPPDGGYANDNTAEGTNALFNLTTGAWNTALGFRALFNDTTASKNTAVGYTALYHNNGQNNVAIGSGALYNNTTGQNNIAIGKNALYYDTTGSNNILIGALYGAPGFGRVTTGSGNTVIGNTYYATPGFVNIGGVLVDPHTDYRVPQVFIKAVNNIVIGAYGIAGDEITNSVSINGSNVTIDSGFLYATAVHDNPIAGSPVVINSQGQLGVAASSARFKDEVKPMDETSKAILALKPVTFRYKKELDPKGAAQFGLVAEEVEKVAPDLVSRDAKGNAYTVRYDAVNAMLLNEFLKAHRRIEEQEHAIAELKAEVAGLSARVNKQAEQVLPISVVEISMLDAQQIANRKN
jgi:hypothetical protein